MHHNYGVISEVMRAEIVCGLQLWMQSSIHTTCLSLYIQPE